MSRNTFTSSMQSDLEFSRAFEENQAVSSVDAHILEIVDDRMSSNFLSSSPKAMYARYIRVARKMIKKKGVLPLLMSIPMEMPVVKKLGITHLNESGLYTFIEEYIRLIIQAADASVKNNQKPAHFHASAFHRHARALLDELLVRQIEHGEKKFPTLALVLKRKFSR